MTFSHPMDDQTSVTELRLSERTVRILQRAKIQTVCDVFRMGRRIVDVEGMGRRCLVDLNQGLVRRGWSPVVDLETALKKPEDLGCGRKKCERTCVLQGASSGAEIYRLLASLQAQIEGQSGSRVSLGREDVVRLMRAAHEANVQALSRAVALRHDA